MAQVGSFALLLALALSAYSFLAGLLALVRQDQGSERLGETARRAGIAVFAAVLLAAVVLVVCAFQDNFTIAYIFHHSNRALPAPYKFATLWSGQEGSLLFWSLLLAAYGFVLRLRYKTDPRLFAYASVILAAVQIFFLLLLNFAAHPFAILQGPLRADGSGLNPLLQYPEMVIHPPMLYLGYVGFTVPFAFALGALAMKYPGEKWIHITRRWTMVTWGFLTCGVFLGAHWAYSVLGWGGYWGWDPVENASFMPWLTGTAFLHSVMMQEKRGMLKTWNVWLIFSTFGLSIFGTFLTRSGVVSSVHAFAQSSIGDWFVAVVADDRRRTAAGVAPDISRKPDAQLPLAGAGRACHRNAADRIRHAAVERLGIFLLAHDHHAIGHGGAHRNLRVRPRRPRDRAPYRTKYFRLHGASGAPQHPPLRRIHCSLRRDRDYDRLC